jgi:hypothetical protein
MRRAAMLAVVMMLAVSGVAHAAPPSAIVTGDYTYQYGPSTSTIQLSAHAGDPAKGWFSYVGAFASFGGPVSCVVVDGPDAMAAGPMTYGDGVPDGSLWAIRIRDAGTPGASGDTAVTFFDAVEYLPEICGDPEILAELEEYMVPVTAGNLVVHPAR